MTNPSDSLLGETLPPLSTRTGMDAALPCLTIAYHPDPSRVGERFLLEDDREVPVSRLEPAFEQVRGALARPLADRHLSRSPVGFRAEHGRLIITCERPGQLRVRGEARDGVVVVPPDELERGVVVELSRRVLLIAHRVRIHGRAATHDLVGESDGIERVRRAIDHIAGQERALLLSGETGAGKERVARALHAASAGAGAPFVAVNMAALPAEAAGEALFGSTRDGSATDDECPPGLVAQAAGGSLLLDEIGDAAPPVQAMLLRVFETRTYQPLGGTTEHPVRARIIATSTGRLADAVERGRFRAALFHRVAAHEVVVPPLRERRDDIARLAVHVAAEQLAALDRGNLLAAGDGRPWFPLELMERLVTADWPGNVRELANTVRQLVLRGIDQPSMPMPPRPERCAPEPLAPVAVTPTATSASDVESLLAALRTNDWALGPTAASLGVPRSTLYDRMARAGIRAARDISDDDLAAAFERLGGDVGVVSEYLRVSRRAVVLRLRAMGLLS